MAWLSRNNFGPSDYIHADDLNNLANDDRTWGGNVNGGGYILSNVTLEGVQLLGTGQVTSVFGRSGDVIAEPGDYTAAQVGAVPITRNVNAGAGLLGGGQLNQDVTLTAQVISVFGRTGPVILTPPDIAGATGVLNSFQILPANGTLTGGGNLSQSPLTFAVVPNQTDQKVLVAANGYVQGTRHCINFSQGTYISIQAVDVPGSDRVDVGINCTLVPGMGDPTTTTGDLIVRGSGVTTRLPVGSNGQILYADSTQPLGVKWALPPGANPVTSVFGRTGDVVAGNGDYSAAMVTNAVDATGSYANPPWITSFPWSKITNPPNFLINVLTTKGDIPVQVSATAQGRLPVGSDGSILTADSGTTLGVKWASVPLALVTSVFGRTGAVVATNGDYSVDQITGAVANTVVVGTGNSNVTGLSGGGPLNANLNLTQVPNTVNQQVQILNSGALRGTRHAINFIVGANIALSIQDNDGSDWVDVAVASNGGGTGLADPTTTTGDLIVRGIGSVERLPVGASGAVLTADSSQPLGMKWVQPIAGGGQTPWVGDVNGAGFKLNNTGAIGVNANSNPSAARIYVVPSSMEDGLAVVSGVTTAFASIAAINDAGATLHIRSYGSAYPTDPGIASIEASAALKFLASGGEVMRLHSGHLLVGTATDDNTNMVQVNGKVKSLAGGFVFPDGTIQTTAFTSGSSAVTSVFGRNGAVIAATGDYDIAQVTHGVSTLGSYADPAWITSLSWGKIAGVPSNVGLWQVGSGGAIYYNGGSVGIGTASPQEPLHVVSSGVISSRFDISSANISTTTPFSEASISLKNSNATSGTGSSIASVNAAGSATAAINLINIGAGAYPNNGGAIAFSTYDGAGGAGSVKMYLSPAGNVGIGTSSPATLLTVYQVGSQTDFIRMQSNFPSNTWAFRIRDLTEGDFGIRDVTANAYRLYINASGKVGIGTSSPDGLLTAASALGELSWQSASVPSIPGGSAANGLCIGISPNAGYTLLWASSLYTDGGGGTLMNVSNYNGPALVIDNARRVGIGAASPISPLMISKDAANVTGSIATLCQVNITGYTNQNQRLALAYDTTNNVGLIQAYVYGGSNSSLLLNPSGGNVGIGKASPGTALDINGNITIPVAATIGNNTASSNVITFGTASQNTYIELCRPGSTTTEIATAGNSAQGVTGSLFGVGYSGHNNLFAVDNAGNLGLGGVLYAGGVIWSASGGFKFPDGTVQTTAASGAAGITQITWQVNGTNLISFTAGNWIYNLTASGQSSIGDSTGSNSVTYNVYSASDARAKQNIETLMGGLEVIGQIRPVRAEWNGALRKTKGEKLVGVIAQEIAPVLPEAVYTVRTKLRPEDEDETDVLGLEPMAITAHLILAVQQLQARIEELEKRKN